MPNTLADILSQAIAGLGQRTGRQGEAYAANPDAMSGIVQMLGGMGNPDQMAFQRANEISRLPEVAQNRAQNYAQGFDTMRYGDTGGTAVIRQDMPSERWLNLLSQANQMIRK
jgi:hypothetical protein